MKQRELAAEQTWWHSATQVSSRARAGAARSRAANGRRVKVIMMTNVDRSSTLGDFLFLQNCSSGEMSADEEITTLAFLYIQPVTSLQENGHSLDE